MRIRTRIHAVEPRSLDVLAQSCDCLHAGAADRAAVLACAQSWLRAFSPRVLRASPRLGFDVAWISIAPSRIARGCTAGVMPEFGDVLACVRVASTREVASIELSGVRLQEDDALHPALATALCERLKEWRPSHDAGRVPLLQDTSSVPDILPPSMEEGLADMASGHVASCTQVALRFPWAACIEISALFYPAGDDVQLLDRFQHRVQHSSPYHEQSFLLGTSPRAPDQPGELPTIRLATGQSYLMPACSVAPGMWAAALMHRVQAVVGRARMRAERSAWREFSGFMDARAVETTAACGMEGDLRTYNWLLAGGDARTSALRRQAMEVYPAILSAVIDPAQFPLAARMPSGSAPPALESMRRKRWRLVPSGHPSLVDCRAIVAAIDQSEPLAPVLCRELVLTLPSLRALQGVALRDREGSSVSYRDCAHRVATVAPFLPSGHWPRAAAGAPSVEAQWHGLLGAIDFALGLQSPAHVHLVADAPGFLAAQEPFWRTQGGLERMAEDCFHAVEVRDMAYAFCCQVLMPLALDAVRHKEHGWKQGQLNDTDLFGMVSRAGPEGAPSVVSACIVRGRGILRLVDAAAHWHRHQARIEASIVTATDERTWPSLFCDRPCGLLRARCLASAAALAEEGAAMQHCVGGYVRHCLYDRTHIVSLHAQDGTRVSTLELSLEPREEGGRPGVAIVQNQGPRNADPSPSAEAAARALVGDLLSGACPADWEGIETALLARQSADCGEDEITEIIGYDPDDEAGRDAALAAWSFLLPRSERGLRHAEWAARLGLPAMVQRTVPALGRFHASP